jgi:hypothetical protein
VKLYKDLPIPLASSSHRTLHVIEILTKRKSYNRRYIQAEETLTVSEVLDLITKREGSSYKEGKELAKRVRVRRRCGYYSEIRHNSRTCKVEIKDVNNSNASK